jgi:hypothetical protein
MSKLLDNVINTGADVVAAVEDAIGGPLPCVGWNEYAERVPLGDARMKFTRCSWRSEQVLKRLTGRHCTFVLNLCSERSDADAVHAAGMMSLRCPIQDGHPPDRAQAEGIVAFAWYILTTQGEALAFGCEAGIGRTGCVAALILVKCFGWTPQNALEDAEKHGTGIIQLTPMQRDWILAL